jgi:hypothetical protein
MLQFFMIVGMVYAIAWIVSTPESRAAGKPWADKWGKRLLITEAVLIAALWLWDRLR